MPTGRPSSDLRTRDQRPARTPTPRCPGCGFASGNASPIDDFVDEAEVSNVLDAATASPGSGPSMEGCATQSETELSEPRDRSAPSAVCPLNPTVRERLLAAADELFYSEGIHTVGVDRLVQKAGVAKASLYNLFGSKEALVQAYLDARTEATREHLDRTLARLRTPRERLLGVFEAQAETFAQPNFNGSSHLRASSEAGPESLIERANDRYRQWLSTLFTDLAREAGAADYEGVAKHLRLLYDGAAVSARMDRDFSAASSAQAAATLLDAAAQDRNVALLDQHPDHPRPDRSL